MARTIDNIYNDLVAIKDNLASFLTPLGDDANTLRSDIQSPSKVAIWRLLLWTMAVGIHKLETNIDEVKEAVIERKEETPAATLKWYQLRAFEFRKGYSLQFINNTYQFTQTAKDDDTAAIVKRASAVEQGTQVLVKVADLDSNDNPTPLSNSELNSFSNYLKKIKPAGVPARALSEPPDQLKVEMEVKIDPLVLKSNGEKINEQNKFPVNDAIEGYIEGLEFDAIFNLNDMIDAIQVAEGVVDPIPEKVQAKPDSQASYQVIFDVIGATPVKQTEYSTFAGYMKLQNLTVNYTT